MAARLPHPKPQRADRKPRPGVDPVLEGKKGGGPRYHLRLERRTCRLLDDDNFAGGCKGLIDLLRTGKIIPNDDRATLQTEYVQTLVRKASHQGTRVLVTKLPEPGTI